MTSKDFDRITKAGRTYALLLLALLAAAWLFWIVKTDPGRPEVGAKLEEIKHDAEQNARRVDVIYTEKEAKEAAAKDEVQKAVNDTASADLPDMLSGLLRDYRKR